MRRGGVLVALFALFAAAAVAERVFLEYEQDLALPEDWKLRADEAVPQDYGKEVLIALKQRNRDLLEKIFWEVSDPQHPKYGQHLTNDQVTELVRPSERTVSRVMKWLTHHGIQTFTFNKNGDFLTLQLTVAEVESLLNVKFSVFEHVSGVRFIGTLQPYSVPKQMKQFIDVVAGVTGLPLLKVNSQVQRPTPLAAGQGRDITPDVIRARYNVTTGLINSNPKNSHAVAEFQGQYYAPSDLTTFFKKYVTVGTSFDKIAKVVGTNQASNPGIEASLDVQYLMGVAPNTTTWFISIAAFPFFSDLLKWAAILSNTSDIPFVHSISYGLQGDYPPVSYRERLDGELQKLGVRGLSIIFASGDSGAGCDKPGNSHQCRLAPSYPATNIYVTSVGATGFISGNTGPEKAVSAFKSGGGFSYALPLPDYQASVVKAYLGAATKLPPSTAYNASGRATPDVSALGDIHFQVEYDGKVTPVGGTSASAPTFAAIITFLNQIRLNNGKSPLGFLNPFLYQTAAAHPDAFFDVVVGNSIVECCTGLGGKEISGFETAPGWDPVTGLGTPNFEVLRTLV